MGPGLSSGAHGLMGTVVTVIVRRHLKGCEAAVGDSDGVIDAAASLGNHSWRWWHFIPSVSPESHL